MASVEKRKTKTGETRYLARWRDPDGEAKSRTFARKGDAERHLIAMQHRMLTGEYVDPSNRDRLRQYVEVWSSSRVSAPNTIRRQDQQLRDHVLPRLGDVELRRIRTGDVEAAVAAWSTKLAPGTVRNTRALLSQILNAAVRDRVIASNPAKGVATPRVVKERVTPLTPEQMHAWTMATSERQRIALVLMAGCGLRIGEAVGLTVDRLDMLRGTMRVDRQLLGSRLENAYFGPPKSEASVRTIPMPTTVREMIAAHLAAFGTGHMGTVVSSGSGSSVLPGTLRALLYRSVERASLPAGTSPHDARHHYASVLIGAGCSVKVVQDRLGHKTAGETLETYAHLWPDDDDRTRRAIDDAIGGLLTPESVYGPCTRVG